jgi:SAM-dependent methyltransferase
VTALTALDQAATSFEPVADGLRKALLEEYERTGSSLSGAAGLRTLETNSGLAARRGNSLLALLARHQPQLELDGLRVVDLGSGFGALAVYLAFLGAEVTAVDVNVSRLEVGGRVARQHGLRVRPVHGSLQELPLPDRSFDLAVINNALCYVVPRPERIVSLVHVRRVLVPGGMLLMRNPNRTAPRDPFTGWPVVNRLPPRLADRGTRAVGRHRSQVRLLSARGQRAELNRVGFQVVDIRAAADRLTKPVDRWVASYQHVLARRP